MRVTIVDSGGANIASVLYAFERLEAEAYLTSDPADIEKAERVFLPGVGAAGDAMSQLHELELIDCIKSLKMPVMGICLGMQLLFSHSEEGNTSMLDIMQGALKKFTVKPGKQVPHMGWNDVKIERDHPLIKGVDPKTTFYFVHSYYAPVADYTLLSCEYDEKFSAVVAKDNFMGCQFHPEISAKAGSQILKNFLEIEL